MYFRNHRIFICFFYFYIYQVYMQVYTTTAVRTYIVRRIYVSVDYFLFFFFSVFCFTDACLLCRDYDPRKKYCTASVFKEGKVGVEGRFFLRHEFFLFFVFVLCQPATYYR